ncbi:hypothetical protein C5167_007552 [Papaver somniferum]|nr:hypothetical protein C5167_007552 [Papaver somniferum]
MGTFSGLAAGIKPVLNFKVEGSSGAVNDMESTMVQKFWDSALALDPPEDDYDTQRKRLFHLMNKLPTIFEVVSEAVKKQQVKEKSSVSNHSNNKSKPISQRNVFEV